MLVEDSGVLHHVPVSENYPILHLTMTQLLMCVTKFLVQLQQACRRHVSKTCWLRTVPLLDVMFGFEEHPQPVHLLPLQLIQLGPKIVVNKVQLFGKFALLQSEKKQHAPVQYKVLMSTNGLQNNGLFSEHAAVP